MRDADRGDLTLLVELYPHLERFFCKPKKAALGRPPDEFSRIKEAYDEVFLIREIWKLNYNGRWVRREKPYAEQIAADRNLVYVHSVKKAINDKARYRDMPSRLTEPPQKV